MYWKRHEHDQPGAKQQEQNGEKICESSEGEDGPKLLAIHTSTFLSYRVSQNIQTATAQLRVWV
jgi:hypothetical protein